eukprot:6026438-Prorocentrum_lima.AAC.1
MELLQGMRQLQQEDLQDGVPRPFLDEELLYTPHGTPPEQVREAGFEHHSCLYEAVAMYLGMGTEDKPVSAMRRHCAEYLLARHNGAWERWDE